MGSIKDNIGDFVSKLCSPTENNHSGASETVWTTQPKRLNGSKKTRDLFLRERPITFTVNGEAVTVDTQKVSATTSLARFVRDHLRLTGTKISCNQAGCGACVITALVPDPAQGIKVPRSVNSCITPVLKCQDWDITTVEGLGSSTAGLNAVPAALATFHGSQCGFCSPGMVMAMNSLLEKNPSPKMAEVEEILDGNICRCTGYRPIFDAFKSLAVDAPKELKDKLVDIEDLSRAMKCPATLKPCNGACSSSSGGSAQLPQGTAQFLRTAAGEWMKPDTLIDLLAILDSLHLDGSTYRLVAGNTGKGIFDDGPFDAYVDVTGVAELTSVSVENDYFDVGAGLPLGDFITLLQQKSAQSGFEYAAQMANHIKKVANTNVRNVGSIGGNLMLKHAHQEFPSDIFLLLETVGALITVKLSSGAEEIYSPKDWLQTTMDRKIVYYITLPKLTNMHKFMSYKITPRSQNAHAYVNGAFLAEVDGSFKVISRPSVVFGGISATVIHAEGAELELEGSLLNDQATLTKAMDALEFDVLPDEDNLLSSGEFRKHLTKALLYKFFLFALGDAAKPELRSASTQISRGISSGKVTYEVDDTLDPIGKPIKKIEADIQCSGEAEYVDDIPPIPNELYAAYVFAKVANCKIDAIDTAPAMAMPGVVAWISEADIDGMNSIDGVSTKEPIFLKSEVSDVGYSGQAIGLIVANTYENAREAAAQVKLTYKDRKTPILTIQQVLEASGRKPLPPKTVRKRTQDGRAVTEVSGEFETGKQYHFHMELQSCIVRPIENGEFDVFSATQWMDGVQMVVAKALDVPKNKVNLSVRRLGGAYGGKIKMPCTVASACAVAAKKLGKPVRLVLDLQTNMEMLGKRNPYLFQYKVTVDESNILQKVESDIYSDIGFSGLVADSEFSRLWFQNCYHSKEWVANDRDVVTDTPSNTYCRAPSSTQGVAGIENIMEHVATAIGQDPLEFRMANLLKTGDPCLDDVPLQGDNKIPALIARLKQECDYDNRKTQVENFNRDNAWKKRGLRLMPMRWPHRYFNNKYKCQVSIFKDDGSVSVSHGGIEMGQGLNTKVVQVVAKELGVDYSKITVKPSNSFVGNNSTVTGGSLGSELVPSAAKFASRELRERMKVVEQEMGNPSWLELVTECDIRGMDLTGRHSNFESLDGVKNYDIWGAVCVEVEVDVLTGEKNIKRADLIEDTGTSISPNVDVGQIEGAFVMGCGLWLSEQLKYDPATGRLLTRDTWEYKPPASQDIPEVFNTILDSSDDNPFGVLGSKCTGEPPLLMAVSVLLAIRDALKAARTEQGFDPKDWFVLNGPATNEVVHFASGIESDMFFL